MWQTLDFKNSLVCGNKIYIRDVVTKVVVEFEGRAVGLKDLPEEVLSKLVDTGFKGRDNT